MFCFASALQIYPSPKSKKKCRMPCFRMCEASFPPFLKSSSFPPPPGRGGQVVPVAPTLAPDRLSPPRPPSPQRPRIFLCLRRQGCCLCQLSLPRPCAQATTKPAQATTKTSLTPLVKVLLHALPHASGGWVDGWLEGWMDHMDTRMLACSA